MRTPVLALLAFLSILYASVAAPPGRVTLVPGTPVSLHATNPINASRIKAGERVDFTVANAVKVGRTVVIRPGATAHGAVLYNRGSGVGFRGEMMLAIEEVQAVDGSWITLRATKGGGDGRRRVLADSLEDLAPPVFPNGKNPVIVPSRFFDAYVDEAATFSLSGGRVTRIVAGGGVRIPDGLQIKVRPVKDISSGKVSDGDPLSFTVVDPVVIGGKTVIAAGAPVTGTVLLSRQSGMANKGGLLVISIDGVKATDGSIVPVTFSAPRRGKGNKEISLGISLVVPFVGMAVKGRQAVIYAKNDLPVYVFEDRFVRAK